MRILLKREANPDYVENLLEANLAASHLALSDRALLQELAFGVVRNQATLDWLIAQKTAGRTQKAPLRIVLRLGLYQLFWLDRIPDHAAVSESVELARSFGCGPQAGFVNALLRGWIRERQQLRDALGRLKRDQPAIGYSHPDWLLARWEKRWNSKFRDLLQWNNTPPKTYARVNTLRTSPDALRLQWQGEGVEAKIFQMPWTEEIVIYELQAHPPLTGLPSFRDGLFYVQDPSTLLAVSALGAQPGENILDFCAAPGGKTTAIAAIINNQGRIVAHDLSPDRLTLVRDNCQRLGATCVDTTTVLPEQPAFDRILIDAPCSNTGVMRRRVDLRWRIREGEIQRLSATQFQLLHRAAGILKSGGVIAYSTCSLEPEENGELVGKFIQSHSNFVMERELDLLPFRDQTDGAYVAVLRKMYD